MDLQTQEHLRENRMSNFDAEACNGNVETESLKSAVKDMIEWLNEQVPNLNVSVGSSLEDLRVRLLDGTVLCQILNRLYPGAVEMGGSLDPHQATVESFLSTLDKMGLPGFENLDLQQGSMFKVLECLQGLKSNVCFNSDRETISNHVTRWNMQDMEGLDGADNLQVHSNNYEKVGTEKQRHSLESNFQTVLQNTNLSGNLGLDIKVSELMNWNSLDKAPMQLLFSIVERFLDESLERKGGDVSHCVASFLKKVVREIECRASNQAEKIKIQNNLCKIREGKYKSKVRALETLVAGAAKESEVSIKLLRQIKIEKTKLEEKKKHGEQDLVHLMNEKDTRDAEVRALKQELQVVKMSYEKNCSQLEAEVKETRAKLQEKIMDFESHLQVSKKKVNELEETFEHEVQTFKRREFHSSCLVDSQSNVLKGLRLDLDSVKREVLTTQDCYPLELQFLGKKIKELVDAAENYHIVLAENRKLYNEVQDLKGSIRVYCRIRPFLPGQNEKQTTIEYIGENGELAVVNPLKSGKDSRRLFKFNQVFAPTASQEEVFIDTQPLIRSVLDGYNVCIFAYGQTGSGKTYTMTGPDVMSKEHWGVNYRALHDLFLISQSRKSSIMYEVGVQMVEIYNEQVRDLLTCNGSQKRLGIWSTTQPNGLAVPDASMHPVKLTNDVLELMNIGFMNRAVGATALNERSSRSHSILTVHVRGTELESKSVLRGCLHLVDLAGSERVDRSEATGDRLREAQYINRSLSALGDVISALAQKSSHVPYRNSKLTQVLQSSLGGQAKTLMFVQLNPDVESYSETMSTLKFAERVSGVELGAAHSNKEGRDVRELMDQVAALKATIAKKDEDIERLRLCKSHSNNEKREVSSQGLGGSPGRPSFGTNQPSCVLLEQASRPTSNQDCRSEQSDEHSETGSQHSVEQLNHQPESPRQPDLPASDAFHSFNADADLLGFRDADAEESYISDSGLSLGTETDGSICSTVEHTLFPDMPKPVQNLERLTAPSKFPKPPQKRTGFSRSSLSNSSSKVVSSNTKPSSSNFSLLNPKPRPPKRWT